MMSRLRVERCFSAGNDDWLRLRCALWPEGTASEHRQDLLAMQADPSRYAVFLLYDGESSAFGLAEATLRSDYVNGTEASPVAFLEGLYVAPDQRRGGGARALVNAVADWASAQGVRELASDTPLDNAASLAVHGALGFAATEAVQYFRSELPAGPPPAAAAPLPAGVTIRVLDAADAQAFQALRLRGLLELPTAFASSWDEEQGEAVAAVAARLADQRQGLVLGAFVGQGLAAVAGVHRDGMKKLAHKACLWGVYVAPEHRRAGLARGLLQAAMAQAREVLQVRQLYLGVNADNAAALALYLRVGFNVYGRERGFLLHEGQLHDELLMARVLQ